MTDQLDLDGLDGWDVTHHGIASRDELELAIVRLAADDAALAYRLQGALSSLITRLRAAEAATAAAVGWQDISTAPRDGALIMVGAPGCGVSLVRWLLDCWIDEQGFTQGSWPTHWQPLPAPPALPSTPVAENA